MNRHARRKSAATFDVFGLAYALHEAYRRAGIPSKDIFVYSEAGPDGSHAMVAARQGEKEFIFDLGPRGMSVDAFERRWTEMAEAVNDGRISEATLQWWYETGLDHIGGAARLVSAMQTKGITIGKERFN